MSLSWPIHPLTLEEWEALPEDNALRVELAEGMLVMSPQPYSWHLHAVNELTYRIKAQVPRTLIALAEPEVLLGGTPPTIRIPDVVVTHTVTYETNPPRYPVSEVLLAVEMLSEGSRRTDRVVKFAEYAEAGIPQYWIVDLDRPTTLTAYLLVDGDYELVAEVTGTTTLDVAGHPVEIDIDGLTRR